MVERGLGKTMFSEGLAQKSTGSVYAAPQWPTELEKLLHTLVSLSLRVPTQLLAGTRQEAGRIDARRTSCLAQ